MKLTIGNTEHYQRHWDRVQTAVPTIESNPKIAFGTVGELLSVQYSTDLSHKIAIVKFEGVSRPCQVHDHEVEPYRPH
jgi:hypothetical protein